MPSMGRMLIYKINNTESELDNPLQLIHVETVCGSVQAIATAYHDHRYLLIGLNDTL